jgi:pycsar effector protein
LRRKQPSYCEDHTQGDTLTFPVGNNVSASLRNYVSEKHPYLGKYLSVDTMNRTDAVAAPSPVDPADVDGDRTHRERAALRELCAAQKAASTEIGRADTKATSLLGLFGAALAAALVLATRTPAPGHAGVFSTVVLGLSTVPLLGAVAALLSVLYARCGGDHGFVRWASYQHHSAALLEYLTQPTDQQLDEQARRLIELSRLTLTKYRRVNLAVVLLLIGLPLLALAALT